MTYVYKSTSEQHPLPTRIQVQPTHVLVTRTGRRIEVNVTDPRMLQALARVYTVEAVKAS